MSLPTLGQRVSFTHCLRRIRPGDFRREWRPVAVHLELFERAPLEGVIVGVRNLSNGRVEHHDWDGNPTFSPAEHFTAYLVAYDIRRKPVYVLPKHTTTEEN